jgi:hypothetical protein
MQPDFRTRLARRARALEHQFTAELSARGVAITIDVGITVSNLAVAVTNLEVERAKLLRNLPCDTELMRSWVTTVTKLSRQLGLKTTSLVEPPPPPRPMRPLSALIEGGV